MNLVAYLLLLFFPQDNVEEAMKSITAQEAHAHDEFLAHESLEGRSAGKRGGLIGRQYVAAQFKRIGLAPPGHNCGGRLPKAEDYFQPIPHVKGAGNVIGIIYGSDLKDEVVVIGAHLDHVGQNADGDAYNGADDNASGTSALIEIAEAMKRLQPRRTVVFIGFDAEESGLIGSAYYVSKPVFPLKKTVAMLNMDMIGRNESNQISAVGTFRTPEMGRVIRKANERVGLDIYFEPGAHFAASDHYSFAVKGIPVVHFFSGLHEDYHGIGDTSDKVDPIKISRVARVCFLSAWMLATQDGKPKVEVTEEQIKELAGLKTPDLIERTRSKNSLLRYLAVENLARRKGEEAYEALVTVLKDPEDFVKKAAVRAFGFRRDPRAGALIVPFLKSKDFELRSDAIQAVGRLKATDAVPDLILLAGKRERGALRALGEIGGEKALAAVKKLFADPSRRAEAVPALSRMKAFDLLKKGLEDESEQIRLLCARAFRSTYNVELPVDALLKAMKDKSPSVRAAVTEALVRSKDERVRKALEEALGDSAFEVRLAAAGALIPSEKAVKVMMRDFAKAKPFPRASIARALGKSPTKETLLFLAKIAKSDPKGRVRKYAVWSLSNSKDEIATKALRLAMSDKSDTVRVSAAGALLRRGKKGAVKVLKKVIFGEGDRYTRAQAVRELGGAKGLGITTILIKCLDQPEKQVVRTALGVLERVTGERKGYRYSMSGKQLNELVKKWKAWYRKNSDF